MTDVLGTCLVVGRRRLRGRAGRRRVADPVTIRSPTSSPGKPVPPRAVDPAPGHAAPRPSAARWRCGRTWRPSRWATGCCAARRPRPLGGPTRCWRWRRPASTGDYERVVAYYEALGQRPIAAVLPDSAEDALFRDHGWVLESHDHDTVFQLAGVAAARRSLAASRCPASTSRSSATTGRVTAEATHGDGRCSRAGSRRTPTTGSGFRTIEVAPPSAAAGSGCWSWPRCSSGAPSAARPRRTSRCWATTPARSRSTRGWASSSTTATATWPPRVSLTG